MQIGERWAYREPPQTAGKAAIPVDVLQFGPPKSKRVRVQFLAGEYPGLDRWVTKGRLIAPWAEIDAFLADEVRYAAASVASGDVYGTVELEAAGLTFYVYPRPDGILLGHAVPEGAGVVTIPDLEPVCQDFGLDEAFFFTDPLAHVDRTGAYVGPWSIALPLAQRVAVVYPALALAYVHERERNLEQIASQDTEQQRPARWAARLHHEQQVFALARAWCGVDAVARFDETEALRAEVTRLRGLVRQAAGWLEGDHPRVANRLRAAINAG